MERIPNNSGQNNRNIRHEGELRRDRQARALRRERFGDIDSIDHQIVNYNVQEEADRIAERAWNN